MTEIEMRIELEKLSKEELIDQHIIKNRTLEKLAIALDKKEQLITNLHNMYNM